MQVDEGEQVLLSRENLFNRIATLTGGRSAEEPVFGSVTTGASNDIEQATKLARAMVTRFGMSEKYDMMGLEAVNNAYLGGDNALTCSPETAAEIDREVLRIVPGRPTKRPVESFRRIVRCSTRRRPSCWSAKRSPAGSSCRFSANTKRRTDHSQGVESEFQGHEGRAAGNLFSAAFRNLALAKTSEHG